jgi:hypothetical protein
MSGQKSYGKRHRDGFAVVVGKYSVIDRVRVSCMPLLRWSVLIACLACVAWVAARGRYEARLSQGNQTWIIDLERSPVWAPPPVPPYERFKNEFNDLPPQGSGNTINRVLKLDWMAVDLFLDLWIVMLLGGICYWASRGTRRDWLLHCVAASGVGLTAGWACCAGMWLICGGWGPPIPELFAGVGLLIGAGVGLSSFTKRSEM